MFFGLSQIRLIAYAAAALAFVGVVVALKVQTARLDATKQEYAGFVAKVKAEGEAAQARVKARETEDKLLKEKADAENKRLRTDLAATTQRLRDAGTRFSAVSRLAPTAQRSDLACFDRAELDAAVGGYQSAILGLVEKGAEAALDLDAVRRWGGEVYVKTR
jgi:hypothetical protein